MSIELKPLTITDSELYMQYYKLADYEGYQTNFNNLYLWQNAYQAKFYYNEQFLITLLHYDDFYFWNLPLTTHEHFKDAIDAILEYCDNHQMPFLMDGVLKKEEDLLQELYPDRFIFKHSIDNHSYIYDASMNRTLSGKKMQKRRNHFNAFMKENGENFVYRHVRASDKEEISLLLDKWSSQKAKHLAIELEKQGILNIVENIDKLNYKMSCIEINGKIEAFILGSLLNHNTVQIHSEKANTEIRGLYVAIFKFFLEYEFSDVLWVNREEDMGIESLRKAKQQLHPIKMLEQSFAYQNKKSIRKANEKDYPVLKQRWLKIFEEDTVQFFDNYIEKADLDIYLLEIDYQLVSTVYLRKIKVNDNKKLKKGLFIEGVSTNHLYEGLGYMKELLKYAISLYPDDIIFIQAYNWDVYKSFEFDGNIYKCLAVLDKTIDIQRDYEFKSDINIDHFKKLYQDYTQIHRAYIDREFPIDIEGYEALYNQDAYILYTNFNGTTVVTEIIYRNQDAAFHLLNQLINTYKLIKVICEDNLLDGESLLFAKYYTKNISNDTKHIFFNEYI